MESELDLNDIIQEMHVVATMPDLYHLLVELNAVQSLLGLLGHDNTDILSDLSSVGWLMCWENAVYSPLVCLCCHVWCSISVLIIYHLETHAALYSFEIWFISINKSWAILNCPICSY